jgi:peptide/histidine transporter 3/4
VPARLLPSSPPTQQEINAASLFLLDVQIAIIVFVAGSRLYRRMPPAGSPFSRIARVLVGAVAHRKAKIPDDDAALHEAEGPMSVVPGQAKLPR